MKQNSIYIFWIVITLLVFNTSLRGQEHIKLSKLNLRVEAINKPIIVDSTVLVEVSSHRMDSIRRSIVLSMDKSVKFKYESISQRKDLKTRNIYYWNLDKHTYETKLNELDTSINYFNIYNPIYKSSIANTYSGNMGSPAESKIYFDRVSSEELIYNSSMRSYFRHAQETNYINTKKRYTRLDYTNSYGDKEKSEQSVRAIHSQNIGENLNFGIDFYNIKSDGQYLSQATKVNSIIFHTSYTNKKYSVHATANINNAEVNENGGIKDLADITDTIMESQYVAVNIDETYNNWKENNFQLVQNYRMKIPSIFNKETEDNQNSSGYFQLSHIILREVQTRAFSSASGDLDFFEKFDTLGEVHYNIDSSQTYDTTAYNRLQNKFQFGVHKGFKDYSSINIIGGINIEQEEVYQVDSLLYVIVPNEKSFDSQSVYGSLYGDVTDSYHYYVFGNIYVNGYRFEDKLFKAELSAAKLHRKDSSYSRVKIHSVYQENRPSYFYNHNFANQFKWENNFERQRKLRLGITYGNDYWRVRGSLNYEIAGNMIYLDSLSMPKQANSVVNIFSVKAEKDFKLWYFLQRNKIVYQASSADILRLPQVSLYSSLMFEKRIMKVLDAQIGVEAYWHSEYYVNDYNPALGMFYVQDKQIVGAYPYVNFFAVAKLKRTRLFMLVEHLNHNLITPNYFSMPYYPRNMRGIKFGLSWTFYD